MDEVDREGNLTFYVNGSNEKPACLKVKSEFYILKSGLVESEIGKSSKAKIVLPSTISMKEFEILHKHITEQESVEVFLSSSQCILTSLKIYSLAKILELKQMQSLIDLLFAPERLILNRVLILWAYSKNEKDEKLQSAIIDILAKSKFSSLRIRKFLKNGEAIKHIESLSDNDVVELLRINQKLRSEQENQSTNLYLDEKDIMHVLFYYISIKYGAESLKEQRNKLKASAEELIDPSAIDIKNCYELKKIFGVDLNNFLRETYNKQARVIIKESQDLKKTVQKLKEENKNLLAILNNIFDENSMKIKQSQNSVFRKEVEIFEELEACDPVYIKSRGTYLITIQFFIDTGVDLIVEGESPHFCCSFHHKLNESFVSILPTEAISFLYYGYHSPYTISHVLKVDEDESLLFTYCSGMGCNIKDFLVIVKKLD